MNIFDLNHIEAVEGTEVLGGSYRGSKGNFNVKINKNVKIKFDEDLDINKDVKSDVDLDDNFAFAEGDAEAFGKSTIAEAFTFTKTVQNKILWC
ncbi:MAG: hypothetical protein HC874_29970 [Richelia sp. SL_2_1]|nr:hypothetical protein [Richelia sp. SL_2_1]